MDCTSNTLSLIIQFLVAVGTIAIAILAIWGDWFRMKFVAPKLIIEPHNLRGTVTNFTSGPRVIYYYLRVVNTRQWAIAKNCRIILRALYRRLPSNDFEKVPLYVPPQFVWAPAEITPPVIELSTQQILDFGRIIEKDKSFQPVLYSYPNDFQGFVNENEAVRYALEIKADGFSAKYLQVFEVAWNGQWNDNLDVMSRNLTIKEVDKISI